MKSFACKSLCAFLSYLLVLLPFASAVVNQPTQPPPTEGSTTLTMQIRVINLQKSAVINGTISSSALQNLGTTGVSMANQAESDAVTAAFDAWVRQNYSILLAQFPNNKAQLDYLVQYGIHYVLLTAASSTASGPSITARNGVPHLMYANYTPHLLFVSSARCQAAGVVGGALGLVGAIGSYYGRAVLGAVIFGFAGAAGVVGAAVLLTAAMYCLS